MKKLFCAIIMIGFCIPALGLEFSQPVIVNQGIDGTNIQPSVFVDDSSDIYVAWVNQTDSGRVHVGVSEDGGLTWTSPSILVNGASVHMYHDEVYPTILVNSEGNIYITEALNRATYHNIFCSLSSDGGNTWSTYQLEDGSGKECRFPSSIIDKDDTLYAIWQDQREYPTDLLYTPYFAKSDDGINWYPMPNVFVFPGFDYGSVSYYQPRLAIDDVGILYNTHYASFYDGGLKRGIFFTKSFDGGFSWPDSISIARDGYEYSCPDIATNHDGTLLCAVWSYWMDGGSGDTYACFSKSTDRGLTWTDPIQLHSDPSLYQVVPRIGLDASENIYVIWQQWPEKKLYFTMSEDAGNTWTTPVYVNDSLSFSKIPPSLYVTTRGMIYAAWDNGNGNIYLSWADNTVPLVTVISPNGGEILEIGDTWDITWIAEDNVGVDSISIFYTTNAGSNWDTIATCEPNDSLYEWIVPDTPSDSCLIKILAYNPSLNMGEDQSDSFFMISPEGINENISSVYSVHLQCTPNPFSKMTEITLKMIDDRWKMEDASLNIYDATGRLVRSFPIINLCNQDKSVVSVCWDGTDERGNEVQSGVYFCRLVAEDYSSTIKFLRVR